METNDNGCKYLNVVFKDVDGSPTGYVIIARVKIDDMKKANDFLITITKENESAKIDYKEF